MSKLTPKQEQFVREYLLDLNATQAAIRAGYSKKTAHSIGPKLLENVGVATAIDALKAQRSQRTAINADWVLTRLAEEAEADLADLYREDGSVKPIHEWPKIWRQGLVAGVKHMEVKDHEGNATGEHIIDLKVSDRVRRLELIGKHIQVNAFQDVIEHKGLDGLRARLQRANQRKAKS